MCPSADFSDDVTTHNIPEMDRSEREKKVLLGLGQAIRQLRRQQGLSQDTFSRKAGLGRSYVAAIERGEKNVAVLNLQKIADALGVPVSRLLE